MLYQSLALSSGNQNSSLSSNVENELVQNFSKFVSSYQLQLNQIPSPSLQELPCLTTGAMSVSYTDQQQQHQQQQCQQQQLKQQQHQQQHQQHSGFQEPEARLQKLCNLQAFSEFIQKNYYLAYCRVDLSPTMIREAVQCHFQEVSTGNNGPVLRMLETFHQLISEFASTNHMFNTLSAADRSKLMEMNGQLFFWYMVSKYLSAKTGVEQLTVLLGPNIPQMSKKIPIIKA